MSESNKAATKGNIKKGLNFEKQLAELQKIVAEMEAGELTLEESLQAYETGIKLTRECQAALESAQQRINILTEKNGVLSEEPFSDPGSNQ